MITTTDVMKNLDEASRVALEVGYADPGVALLADTMAAFHAGAASMEDRLSGAFLEREAPAPMRSNALESVLASIDALEPSEPAFRKAAQAASDGINELIRLPQPLRDLALESTGQQGWKFGGPGIRTLTLNADGDTEVQIMRLQAGKRVPQHTHEGREYTLCLEGGFSDERGSYGPGDLSVADSNVIHTPIADEDGHCLVLTVTDARLKFTGVLGILQRFFG